MIPRNRAQALLQKGDMVGLARLGPEAFPELVPVLRTGSGMKQQIAFWALCANGENALEASTALAHEENAATRLVAARVLLGISSARACSVLR